MARSGWWRARVPASEPAGDGGAGDGGAGDGAAGAGAADDAALVARARRGDAAAFEALVARHYRAVFAVALAVLGSAADAEDATQDAFAVGLARLDDCRTPARVGAWLR